MRIAVAQIRTRAGDLEGTAQRMLEHSRLAAEQGVDLLVFPSAALCGTGPASYPDREGFLLDLAGTLLEISAELACPCIVPILSDLEGTPAPEAVLLSGGEVTPLRLTAFLESAAAGEDGDDQADHMPEFAFAGLRLGIAFTYEDLDAYDDYDYDVDAILFLSGYGFAIDDVSSALGMAVSEARFRVDAETTGAWIVGVGPLGCYEDQVFCGSSFVLAPWGELAAQAPSFEEALLVCDIDPSAEGPLDEPLTPEVYDAPLTTWGALTMGIHGACDAAGGNGACLVVDGGLGSMLSAVLATDALGPTQVHVVELLSGSRERDAAVRSLVANLRVPAQNVTELDLSREPDEQLARDLAQAHLAALARRTGALPLGDADKTALALEPMRGASAARLLPLGDLYRSDVLSLAHLRNTISPVIPSEVVAARLDAQIDGLAEELPTVELQVELVDLVLSSYVEWELPLSDIVQERGHRRVVEAVVRRMRDLEALRPDRGSVIAVSSMTLREARGPEGNVWRDRVRARDERLEEVAAAAIARLKAAQGMVADEYSDDPSREREVHDLLGYLRDFSQGGAFSPAGPGSGQGQQGRHSSSGPSPQQLWEGPFSEN